MVETLAIAAVLTFSVAWSSSGPAVTLSRSTRLGQAKFADEQERKRDVSQAAYCAPALSDRKALGSRMAHPQDLFSAAVCEARAVSISVAARDRFHRRLRGPGSRSPHIAADMPLCGGTPAIPLPYRLGHGDLGATILLMKPVLTQEGVSLDSVVDEFGTSTRSSSRPAQVIQESEGSWLVVLRRLWKS